MQNLSGKHQDVTQIYKLMKDPALPQGRWNHDDQRHLGEAYRDNHVVPYEGTVILVECDHHSGVFLTNKDPLEFHTHTILIFPNAGDYGRGRSGNRCLGNDKSSNGRGVSREMIAPRTMTI